MPGLKMDLSRFSAGITAVPKGPKGDGSAVLKMPDGTTIDLPVLLDSNGDKFIDIRKLQPR